ncbi:MAG: transcriptional regulator [Candidatus Nitrosotenuis sp.]|jgi:DNA-binding Lrp family transcriptional regulator|nr:transcriptional regulator [Candidatus Nitrosotenuis sp.]
MSDDSWSNLDKVDQKVIEILNSNARTPSKDIASELRKSGHDVSDRTIRKRIERLEKSGIIKGYKAVLSDVAESNDHEALFLKFKIAKSIETIKESIREYVVSMPEYLFVANMDGEWNMLVISRIDRGVKNPTSRIVEKFSDDIIDYRITKCDFKNVNLLNMSLLLL